jgi:hypothetical protein|tara:strand:+ start:761 stop:1114 length:354 start_codon:yes stop_codon:yes gene_type:complete
MNKIEKLLLDNEKESENFISDVASHGCVNGCVPELIYYSDTIKFYEENEDLIWEILFDCAESMDTSILTMLDSHNKNVGNLCVFKNLCVWFAVDMTAIKICNEREQVLTDSHGNEIG